jgi:hypothetical protein
MRLPSGEKLKRMDIAEAAPSFGSGRSVVCKATDSISVALA